MEPTIEQVEAILDQSVRPILAGHGGNIVIQSLKANSLKVKLTGKCSGCPAAHATNEELVSAEIRSSFPSITEVILVEGVSPELLKLAHEILNRKS